MAKFPQLEKDIDHILKEPISSFMTTVSLSTIIALITTLTLTSVGSGEEKPNAGVELPAAQTSPARGTIRDRKNKPLAIDDEESHRAYPAGKPMAHVIGYVRAPTADDSDQWQGVFGLENTFNAELNQKKDFKLTIDSALQNFCYKLLAQQEFPGVIVVQDPHNGEIIAMASYPSFDPNLFIPAITRKNFDAINNDKNHPMLNRATQNFVPGSVVKPLVALAGEHAGLKNPEIHCRGFMAFGRVKIRDWKTTRNEKFRIPGALEQSCNTYFMELGIRAGEESLSHMGQLLHLHEPPLSSLPSSKSRWMFFPDGENPTRASLAVATLGQGHSTMTPLHINTITSALATGSWHEPHLVIGQPKSRPSVSLSGQGNITADSLKAIRTGLHLAVHGDRGTAKRAAIPGLQLAGKSGTAQLNRNKAPTHNSWFTGYGPYENPKYSITVMLNGATSGGRFAAPMAAAVFELLLGSQ